MNSIMRERALPVAVVALCVWQASDLVVAWRHSPLDRLGWLALLLWALPAGWALFSPAVSQPSPLVFPLLAILLVIAGGLLDLNALRCFGLAFALAAFPALSLRQGVWLASAVGWMPVLGWLGRDLPAGAITLLRLLLPVLGSGWWFLGLRKIQSA